MMAGENERRTLVMAVSAVSAGLARACGSLIRVGRHRRRRYHSGKREGDCHNDEYIFFMIVYSLQQPWQPARAGQGAL